MKLRENSGVRLKEWRVEGRSFERGRSDIGVEVEAEAESEKSNVRSRMADKATN